MIVHGYKSNANFLGVKNAIRKHTNYDAKTVSSIVSQIQQGKSVTLPDDFVLREDLEDANLLIA